MESAHIMDLPHVWSRVRSYPGHRWMCRRCGRLFKIRTWRACAHQYALPGF